MDAPGLIQVAPLPAAAVWWAAAGYQILKGRYHTWSELFLILGCAAAGGYALGDAFFFGAQDPAAALDAAFVSDSMISFVILFLSLYCIATYRSTRTLGILLLLPVVALVVLQPIVIIQGVAAASSGIPYVVVYAPGWVLLWIGVLLAYGVAGVVAYALTVREVARSSRRLARRMAGILASLVLVALLAAATNILDAVSNVRTPPLLSTLLVVPGLLILVSVLPRGRAASLAGLYQALSRRYRVLAALLVHEDGSVIGALAAGKGEPVDPELMDEVTGIIRNYVARSSQAARLLHLEAVAYGTQEILLEPGSHAFLVVVIEGTETDHLRILMRDELEAFEVLNLGVLTEWETRKGEAIGAEDALRKFAGG